MLFFRKAGIFSASAILATLLSIQTANAASVSRGLKGNALGGGSHSLGLGFSIVTSNQTDMNAVIAENNAGNSANSKDMTSAYEFYANWIYRFGGSPYAFVLRPSYFMQESKGSGTGGSYNYNLNGFTVFPIVRMYPLENDFIHFFLQGGVGYGSLTGQIDAAANNLKFNGSAFGAMAGMGVDFCFTESHCVTVEGNIRYLPVERNMSEGGNCSGSSITGISQCGNGLEVEHGNSDLRTTMSGVLGVIGYTMNF